MIPENIVSKILWSAIEDFVGLWEIVWELNSINSKWGKRKSIDSATFILNYLFNKDLIKLYFSTWGKDILVEIPQEKALKLLNEEKYWKAPFLGEKCIKIGSTIKGEDFYKRGKISDIAEY